MPDDNPSSECNQIGKLVETAKQLAAIRQIHAAIWMFRITEFECAITLAAAAEGLISPTDAPHVFQAIKAIPDFTHVDFNFSINWLKHPIEPEIIVISEFEVVMIIIRAISKFLAVYKTASLYMRDFGRWAFEKGYLPFPTLADTSG